MDTGPGWISTPHANITTTAILCCVLYLRTERGRNHLLYHRLPADRSSKHGRRQSTGPSIMARILSIDDCHAGRAQPYEYLECSESVCNIPCGAKLAEPASNVAKVCRQSLVRKIFPSHSLVFAAAARESSIVLFFFFFPSFFRSAMRGAISCIFFLFCSLLPRHPPFPAQMV